MPRVTHVKRAQQRYATKPVIDPETGVQKVVPMMNSRTGEQKKSKSGRLVFMKITERDLDKPLPMPKCDAPECKQESREIKVGESYKWIEPSGQRVKNRHEDCPTWNVWEYSSSLSARIAQIQNDGPSDSYESLEDAQAWASEKAEEIRGLAEEKRESASNIEEGFGHETYQSAELNEIADNLEQWADDLENIDLPEYPEGGSNCDDCDGSGTIDGDDQTPLNCETCGGSGTLDEPTDDEITEWQAEVQSALEGVFDEAPC